MEKEPTIPMQGEELEAMLKEIRADKKLLKDLESELRREVKSYDLWPIFKEAGYSNDLYNSYVNEQINSLIKSKFETGYPLGVKRTQYEFLRTTFRMPPEQAIKILKNVDLKVLITIAVEEGTFEINGKEYKLPNFEDYIFVEEKNKFYKLTKLEG